MIFHEPRELKLKVGDKVEEWAYGERYVCRILSISEGPTFLFYTVAESYTIRGFAYSLTDRYLTESELENISTIKRLLCSRLDRIIPL
jgi:hypothetical protein